MDREWFKEKIADKVLIGIIAACISTFAFGLYDTSARKIANAQKNAEVYVSEAKMNFKRYRDAIDDAEMHLELFEKNIIIDAVKLQTAIAHLSFVSNGAVEVFKSIADVSDPNLNAALSFCSTELSSNGFELDKVNEKDTDRKKLIKKLNECEFMLVPAFSGYLGVVSNKSFDESIARNSVKILGLHISWPMIFIVLLLVAFSGVAAFWYCRLPKRG